MLLIVINGDNSYIYCTCVVIDRGYSTNYGLILNKQCYNSIIQKEKKK